MDFLVIFLEILQNVLTKNLQHIIITSVVKMTSSFYVDVVELAESVISLLVT